MVWEGEGYSGGFGLHGMCVTVVDGCMECTGYGVEGCDEA